MDGHNPAADPRWYPGDAAATTADEDGSAVGMFDGHYTTDDLFEFSWQVGGEEAGTTRQSAVSCLRSSPPPATPPPPLPLERMSFGPPPSQDVMAAWLYTVISGQGLDGDCLKHPSPKQEAREGSLGITMTAKSKLPATDGTSGAKDIITSGDTDEKAKATGGSSSRKGSSHRSATHNITEKRRRCKITERLRTLQKLVPGCEKSNQASTLDQTIQYMKSLQQQVQTMNTSRAPPLAVNPFAMPMPPTVGTVIPPAGMVQFGVMVPYPHYQAVVIPSSAAAARYQPAPGAASVVDPDATGGHAQCSVSLEQQQHQHEKKKKVWMRS